MVLILKLTKLSKENAVFLIENNNTFSFKSPAEKIAKTFVTMPKLKLWEQEKNVHSIWVVSPQVFLSISSENEHLKR